jgi:hypothetical protein
MQEISCEMSTQNGIETNFYDTDTRKKACWKLILFTSEGDFMQYRDNHTRGGSGGEVVDELACDVLVAVATNEVLGVEVIQH